ncbi:hypothetical protein [Ruminococcus sp.]|uniref:hypothetical protein n=1 Tax=Ruminococcus sp. TaxID=41978 RepID=UPI001B636F71|nr:hypothetical protein [Ruminococcus sp.]MBP5431129.1 hypothetical protein [Ruminococcus sp.]
MFDTRFEHTYTALVKIWNKYPDIKLKYLKTNGSEEETIDRFIQNNYSECFFEMEQVIERYYGESRNIPSHKIREFFSRYFGMFWYSVLKED